RPQWTRLIRYQNLQGQERYGEPVDPTMDIGLALANAEPIMAPWENGRRLSETEQVHRLLSPISAEMCGLIRAVGLNYVDHAIELKVPIPTVPTLFFKPSHAIAPPNTVIIVPPVAQDEELDFEVELAVIIGRETKDAKETDAMDHVLGYTVANDLTARKHWQSSSQWGFCKGFDGFCPLGPCIVAAHAMDPHQLSLTTHVNGEIMQNGLTSSMIFSISKLVSYLSQGTTLPAGTVIITGTPPGIGDSRSPKVWLRHGDVVECAISGGIGTLINTIEYGSPAKINRGSEGS
ncbi:hypothetical protein BD324DRAFT_580819, partial [Kockovaella imperatae]